MQEPQPFQALYEAEVKKTENLEEILKGLTIRKHVFGGSVSYSLACENLSETYNKFVEFTADKAHKKIYKLSEMWKGWLKFHTGYAQTQALPTKEEVVKYYTHEGNIVAITRANATEFFEGEGLD